MSQSNSISVTVRRGEGMEHLSVIAQTLREIGFTIFYTADNTIVGIKQTNS